MRQSGLGIASLVLGIIGFLFSALFIGIVPCIISVILAIIVIRNKDEKHSLAIIGLILSIIGIILFSMIYLRFFIPKKEELPQEMSFGETYVINDIFEFTPIEGKLSPIICPSNQKGTIADIYEWITGENNELPYELTAKIKNIGTEEINAYWNIDAEVIINDTYRFDATLKMENAKGDEFESEDLTPLQERTFHIYAFVPQEIWSICESCTMNLAFPDDYQWSGDLDHDPIYTITFDENKIKNDQ